MFRFSAVLVALIATPVAASAQTLVGTWTLTGYSLEGGPGPYGWVSTGQAPVVIGAMPGPGGVTLTGLMGHDERPLLIFTEDGLAIAVDPAGSSEAPIEASTVEFSALQLGYASEIVRYQVEGSTLRYVPLRVSQASPPSRGRSRESEIVEHNIDRLVTRTTDDTGRTLTMVYLRARPSL